MHGIPTMKSVTTVATGSANGYPGEDGHGNRFAVYSRRLENARAGVTAEPGAWQTVWYAGNMRP
jgi:hypothetical protein